jgi:hypothetical protein
MVFSPKIHRGQRIFLSKAISNALAEISKPRIGSEQVIKLYSNFKSFNLIFPIPKVKYEIIFHNFVCPKYAGALAQSSRVK